MQVTPNLIFRFWKLVEKHPNGCWLWAGANARGYGKFRTGPVIMQAHVVSWLIHVGEVPKDYEVMHDCPGGDNRLCVNPAHLKIGSHKDNMADMVAKGRQGKKTAGHKLSGDQVRAIRTMRRSGVPYKRIREQFGIKDLTIWRIATGVDYKHIKD